MAAALQLSRRPLPIQIAGGTAMVLAVGAADGGSFFGFVVLFGVSMGLFWYAGVGKKAWLKEQVDRTLPSILEPGEELVACALSSLQTPPRTAEIGEAVRRFRMAEQARIDAAPYFVVVTNRRVIFLRSSNSKLGGLAFADAFPELKIVESTPDGRVTVRRPNGTLVLLTFRYRWLKDGENVRDALTSKVELAGSPTAVPGPSGIPPDAVSISPPDRRSPVVTRRAALLVSWALANATAVALLDFVSSATPPLNFKVPLRPWQLGVTALMLGLTLGAAQAFVLWQDIRHGNWWLWWVLSSAIGAIAGSALELSPQVALIVSSVFHGSSRIASLVLTQAFFFAPIGIAQWLVLGRLLRRSDSWIWIPGTVVAGASTGLVGPTIARAIAEGLRPSIGQAGSVAAASTPVWLVYGLLTGLVLVWLFAQERQLPRADRA